MESRKLVLPNNILKKLNKKTLFIGEHWIYNGQIRGGYGRIEIKGVTYTVIRLSAYIFHDLDYFDFKKIACHKDDICNDRRCWNPKHIYVGTHAQNTADAIRAGKEIAGNRPKKLKCKWGHTSGRNSSGDCYGCIKRNNDRRKLRNVRDSSS